MSESASAARSWLGANAERLGVSRELLDANDLHLHVPQGAVKKDGPSAGVAMAVALTSITTDQPVRADVAITGEITLRGLVLPVGGIKSKVLAAHRAGSKVVVLPEGNRKDAIEIPPSIQAGLDIRFVRVIDEALAIAFGTAPAPTVEPEAEAAATTDGETPPPRKKRARTSPKPPAA
jgi:ATP-dependent Lon protease